MLHFYEKPGCINNGKQKTILRKAGVSLVVYDLLTTPWSKETLRPFFGSNPVAEWFNPSAPAVKEKRIKPHECSADEALSAMLKDPLLIRRPLMRQDDWYCSGFDWPCVQQALGLADVAVPEGIERCAHDHAHDDQHQSVTGGCL